MYFVYFFFFVLYFIWHSYISQRAYSNAGTEMLVNKLYAAPSNFNHVIYDQ